MENVTTKSNLCLSSGLPTGGIAGVLFSRAFFIFFGLNYNIEEYIHIYPYPFARRQPRDARFPLCSSALTRPCTPLCLCVTRRWVKCCSTLQTRRRCMQLGGLHFKRHADHDPRCRRSLQGCAASIPFDAAEKKVTGGAWFGISLDDLPAGFGRHHKDVFWSCCRLRR